MIHATIITTPCDVLSEKEGLKNQRSSRENGTWGMERPASDLFYLRVGPDPFCGFGLSGLLLSLKVRYPSLGISGIVYLEKPLR